MDHVGGVSDEEGVAGGPTNHADHDQPQIQDGSGRLLAVAYTQHVRHGPEQSPAVLLRPLSALNYNYAQIISKEPAKNSKKYQDPFTL